MKNIGLCLAGFLCVFFSYGQSLTIHLKNKQLQGKVKMLKKVSYYDSKAPDSLWEVLKNSPTVKQPDLKRKFNSEGFQIEVITYDENGKKKMKTVDEFNSKNQHIHSRSFHYSPQEILSSHTAYTYDANGNMIEIKWFDSRDNLKTRQTFEYNQKEQVVKQTQFRWDGDKQWYKTTAYDEHGNPVEFIEYNIDRDTQTRKTSIYDEIGNLIFASDYNPDGSLKMKKAFKYNEQEQLIEMGGYISGEYHIAVEKKYNVHGKIIKEFYYNEKGASDGKRINTYDARGNLTANTDFDAEGKKTWRKTYRYYYDEQNNWILKAEKWRGQTTLIKREISYFD